MATRARTPASTSASTPARTAAKTPTKAPTKTLAKPPALKPQAMASKAPVASEKPRSADPALETAARIEETKAPATASPETARTGEAPIASANAAIPAVDLAHAADDPHIFDDPVTSSETIETTTEQLDMMSEFVRKFAESGLAQSRDALDGLRNSADRATVNFEQSTIALQDAGRELNVRAISAVKAGTDGMFDCMVALAGAKSWQEAATLYNEHLHRQFAQLRECNRELAEACGEYARKTIEPFKPAA